MSDPFLPLAPFEEYMLCEDTPSHPMCFFLRLKFSGSLDTALLDDALAQAVARHPLLSSVVVRNGRNRLYWQLAVENVAQVKWQTELLDGRPPAAESIDLEKETGLRVYGRRTTNGVELLFQFHHACCDAIGGLQLIEDVLLDYVQRLGECPQEVPSKVPPSGWRTIDPQLLARRAKFGLTRWQLLAKLKQQAVGLIGAWQFLMRTPSPLSDATVRRDESAFPFYPAAWSTSLNAAATEMLLSKSRALRTTFNNLLICKLLQALSDFRSSRSPSNDRRWLRLSIPINLRRTGDEYLSAANVVSMVFIDRRAADLADEQTLLRSIHDQMQQIKDLDLGLTFPLSLRFFTSLPGYKKRMQRMSDDPRCRCTAVLSNLMRPLSNTRLPRLAGKIMLGECELTGIEFLPPVRPGTAAAFGVLTYGDQLIVTLHYDASSLTPSEAREMLDGFVAQLQSATHPEVVNASLA